MTRTVYYTATTLDGFVASPEHSLDWLLTREADHEADTGYQAFEKRVGALVMGASTYEWIQRHGEEWTYDQPAWVLTHRELTPYEGADVRFTAADTGDELRALHAELAAAAGTSTCGWSAAGRWPRSSPGPGCSMRWRCPSRR